MSLIRDRGNILHSSELLSFVFWKVLSLNKARIPVSNFVDMLKVFKFKDVNADNFREKLSYSLKEGELIDSDQHARFDLFRQIFNDREL